MICIPRPHYLDQLLERRGDGLVKVITGVRRCGKSFLLDVLFRKELTREGVPGHHIISIHLDQLSDIAFRDPLQLVKHVRSRLDAAGGQHYLFVDEIQMSDVIANPYNPHGASITFYDALNDLRSIPNLDVYVTGSNSAMLSKDILTNFRGRSDQIHMHPLSFAEYMQTASRPAAEAFDTYAVYGGMPALARCPSDTDKTAYLESLFEEVYFKDILERHSVQRADVLERLTDLLCSSIGSLVSPAKITRTLGTADHERVADNTVRAYLGHLEDAFLFERSRRYDVRGKEYLDTPFKYYAEDIGLRNARIHFRQLERTHILENIVYNELRMRGFDVDVGAVQVIEKNGNGNSVRRSLEVDFVARAGGKQLYMQCAYAAEDPGKYTQEIRPLLRIPDALPRVFIRGDALGHWYDEHGILNLNILEFLLNPKLVSPSW